MLGQSIIWVTFNPRNYVDPEIFPPQSQDLTSGNGLGVLVSGRGWGADTLRLLLLLVILTLAAHLLTKRLFLVVRML